MSLRVREVEGYAWVFCFGTNTAGAGLADNKICYSLISAQHFLVHPFSMSYGLSRFSPACMLLSLKMAGFD
jgi:hypothetical protein